MIEIKERKREGGMLGENNLISFALFWLDGDPTLASFYYLFTGLPFSYFCVPGNISCRGAVKYHSSIEYILFLPYTLRRFIICIYT